MKDERINAARRVLPYMVLIAAYLMSVGLFALYGQHNLDSDMSSEMVLAQVLNEEGSLFSEEWHYSTELRVVSPVPLYQLGLKLFDSWHGARTFAIAVLQLGVILSFLFMARAAGMKEGGVYCAAALILPFSKTYAFVFAYGGFYAAYFIMSCIVIGMMLSMYRSKRKLLLSILMVLSGIWSGMTGVRMLMILGVPLMLACMIALFDQIRRSASGEEVIQSEPFSMMWAALIHFAGMLAGYWINSHILAQKYSFRTYDHVRLVPFGPQNVLEQIQQIIRFLGYEPDQYLLSIEGIASWVVVGFAGFALFSVVQLLKRGGQYGMTAGQRMVPLFALCALAIGILTNESTNQGCDSSSSVFGVAYYISGVLLMVASAFMLLEKLPSRLWQNGIRTLLLLLLSAVFFLDSLVYVRLHCHNHTTDYEDTAQWLTQNGYTQGFATFWNSNVLTEASDGQLEMYVFADWKDEKLYPWLQRKSHIDQLPEGKVFVYVSRDEELMGASPYADEQKLVYEGLNSRVYEYGSALEVMDIQRAYHAETRAGNQEQE